MAKLARYFSKDQVKVSMTPLSVADTGGAQIGRAVQQFGADLDQIAERDENFWVQKTLSETDSQSDREWDEQTQNSAEDGSGFQEGYLGKVDSIHDRAKQGAPSRRAARKLELGLLNQRSQREKRARGFQTEQKFISRKRTILREADNLAQEAYRNPAVEPYSPHGSLVAPGTVEEEQAEKPAAHHAHDGHDHGGGEFFVSEQVNPMTRRHHIRGFQSKYYAPEDFADGKNMADKTGEVRISKRVVSKLDWVTEQFGMGKLQINSGYRSPASNLKRASSGVNGPHTHGEAVDIQVRDLPQSERNRLYSLLKSQGFNAFGFGQGVLHAEIREGKGNGRGGDFEWTYGSASKYQRVPVMQGNTAVEGAQWKSVNQYPHLAMASLTARSETGKHNLVEATASIASDTNGTRSYGIFGINSGGTMQGFVDSNSDLGLTAKPGTPEFDRQWSALAAKNSKLLVERQLKWHEHKVVKPAQSQLVTNGQGRFSNDPRAIAFVSDMVVQYGKGGVKKHLLAAAGAQSVDQFIAAASQSMRDNLDGDFKSYLSQNPDNRRGLIARIDNRAKDSLSLASGNGQAVTGNVPKWNGPVPQIDNVPGYQQRLARIDAMVDTMGGTPAQRATVRDNMRAQVTRSWLSSLAQTNPSAAMSALHSGQYDDVISIADEAAITRGAQSGWKSYEQEIRTAHKTLLDNLKVETRKMVEDEASSLANTGQSTGLLTDQHKAMMSDADRENIELAKFQYDTQKQIAAAGKDELPGILEALEPQGEGFATEQKKFDYAQKLIADRITKQQNDPAGYAVSANAKAKAMWTEAMQSNDPAQIQAAIRAIRQVQMDQGVDPSRIRSVTQSSMTQNETLLKDAETSDQAFANFLQMRELYGSEFGTVLQEMEAEGGAKGWTAVNELAESGNAVLAKSLARVVHAGKFDDGTQVGLRLARQGQTNVARTIFDGRVKRLEVKGVEPKGKSEDTDETQDQIVQRIVGDAFAESPSVIAAVREAAVSHYANAAGIGAPLDGARLEESVKAVTGGILERNGDDGAGRFLAPVPGMTQSQFDKALDMVTDKDLKGAFIGYSQVPSPVTADMMRGDLQFVSSGNGTYFLRYPGAGLARNEQGVPFELNMRTMLPELAKRATTRKQQKTSAAQPIPVDQQIADIQSALADDNLSIEEQNALRQKYGVLWAYRDGKRVVPPK